MKRTLLIGIIAVLSVMAFAAPAMAQDDPSAPSTGLSAQIAMPGYGGSCVQYHIINRGETLASIGRMYGTTWAVLASMNGITNPNWIYAGQTLCVSYAAPQPTTYIVQRGDWLNKIAQRFGMSLGTLMAANDIYNPNLIYPGQVLYIPPVGNYGMGGAQPLTADNNDVIVVPAPEIAG